MPLITETYYLSLTQDNRGILRLRCSQDDTLRTVNLKLYNNGSIFVIPSGISASISGVKQNGAVFSKSCTISQNRESVVLQLSSDITNVDGIIIAEIVLNDGEGGRLGTSNFIIQVEKNPIRAGVVQDTETPIEYINDFIEKIQTLTARLNNLITPSGDPSLAEVVDARIGILDNTTYQTLGARLNAEFQRLNNALNGVTILESTGDTTDRTSEILSKLNTYGICKLGKGDFYVSGLVMPEDSQLIGSGKSTRIILPSSVTDGYVVKPKSNCIIENISFYGGFTGTHSELIASSANATRHCIILDRFNNISSENVILNNIFINNFVGSAIIQRYTTGCHCKDVIINMCYAGIDISNVSYDGQCTNISMTNTRYGVVQNGSNFIFNNCISKDSDQHIMSDQQNTECTFSSCNFFDSSLETTSRLATLSNARNGFVFDNCIFDSSLRMLLNACDGIVIKGTNFVGSDTFRIIVSNGRNTLLLITDCIADVEPVVTNAGTAARITSCYLKDGTAWSISEADITVDEELSDESENPVQNKVINREISEIKADLGESISGYSIGYSDKTQWYNGAISSSGEYSSNTAYMSISNEPLLADTDIYIKVIPNGLKWGMRFFNKNGSVYTQTTSIYNAQDERIVKVDKGLYYCFSVNRGGGAMTPTLNVCNLYFSNFVHDVATKVEYNIIIDYGKFPHTWFVSGTLSQGNVNNSTYRVCTPSIIRLDFDVILTAKDGWRYAIHYFNDGNQYSSDSGWKTNGLVKIASGQGFKLLIRRETEDTSENADIQTFVNSIKVIGGVLTEFDMPIEYTYSVSGQKIDIQKTKYNVIATQLLPSPIAQVGATAYQGTGYSNGTIFQFYKDDYVELIDYETGESIAVLSAPTKHGNSVSFTDEYYATNDEYPIAIVSDSTSEALAYKVRIQQSAVTLLETYKFPTAQAGYYGNVVYDSLNKRGYVVGYTANSFSNGTNNSTIISVWDFTTLANNGDGTYTPTFVKSFILPFINTAQGMQMWNGLIYAISSKVSSTEADTKVYVINPFEERISAVMESFPTEIKTHETEGICFIDDQETVKAIIFTGGYKYREIVFS